MAEAKRKTFRDNANGEPQRLEIRKYPNRRYYDATRSRHVTLEEIHALIRDGREVRVVDSRTEADITGKILTQIILELDTPKLEIFPVPMLHRLIRANERLINEFVEKYFNQALMSFLDSQRQFENYLRQAIGLQGSSAAMPWTQLMLGPLTPQFWGNRREKDNAAPGPEAAADAVNQGLQATIQQLQQQVTSLQKELARKKR